MRLNSADTTARLAAGFALLAVIWIVVYWAWEPKEPPIRFAEESAEPAPAAIGESERPAAEAERAAPTRPAADGAGAAVPKVEREAEKPAAVVEPPKFRTHVVRPGDTFQKIAREYFGTAERASVIARANPFVDPTRLRPGRELRIPVDPENMQGREIVTRAEPSVGARTYTVRSGDTLSGIASRLMGSSRHAGAILRANRKLISAAEDLRPGMELVIPEPEPGT